MRNKKYTITDHQKIFIRLLKKMYLFDDYKHYLGKRKFPNCSLSQILYASFYIPTKDLFKWTLFQKEVEKIAKLYIFKKYNIKL